MDAENESEREGLSPADAFSVVANDVRVDILRALARAERRARARSAVTFSELFRDVAVDDSGRFNYHLERLTGHFVEKTDDGYRLRHAGRKVVRAVTEGAFTERVALEPFEVEGRCHECGSALSASYENGRMAVECRDCGEFSVYGPFPPGGMHGRDEAEIARAFDAHIRAKVALLAEGICPECRGPITSEIMAGSPDHWSYDGFEMIAHHRCQRCDNQMWPAVGLHLLDYPAVRTFHADRGVDADAKRFWTFPWAVTHRHAEIRSKDPWEVVVQVAVADEELHVTLDGDLDVVAAVVER